MHAFRRFIEQQMTARNWTAADLVRASGMSAQHVSKLLNDERDILPRMPAQSTISALARAFRGFPPRIIRGAAIAAMDAGDIPAFVLTLADFDDDALLAEVRRRMQRAAKQSAPPMTEQEQKEWEARERAKANTRLRRNNPATGRPRRRPSGS